MYSDIAKRMLAARQTVPADVANAIPADIASQIPPDVASQIPSAVDPGTASQVADQLAAVSSTVGAVQSAGAKAMSVAETFSSFDNCKDSSRKRGTN